MSERLSRIDQIKAATDVNDDFLAAMLSMMEVQEKVSSEHQSGLSEIESSIESVQTAVKGFGQLMDRVDRDFPESSFRNGLSGPYISFPETGDTFAFPAAGGSNSSVDINLQEGRVVSEAGEFNMATSLDDLDLDRANSLHLWTDQHVTVRTYDEDDAQTGVWQARQADSLSIQGTRVRRVQLESDTPFQGRLLASASPMSPVQSFPVSFGQSRFGHLTTSDQDFTSDTADSVVPFIAPNADQYGESDLVSAASSFGDGTLLTDHVGQCVFIVEEVADNADAEVQLRERHIAGEQEAADNDVHSATGIGSTNNVTVPQNDFVVLETGINSQRKRLMCQSSDGSEVEVRVQYHGHIPGMR